jgi:hypothetical protein
MDYANVNCISSRTFLEILRDFKKVTSSEEGGQHLIPVQEHVQISFSERTHELSVLRTMHVNNSLLR